MTPPVRVHGTIAGGLGGSLPSELWLYAALFLVFGGGGRRRGLILLLAATVSSLGWTATFFLGAPAITVGPRNSGEFSRLATLFFCGAMLAISWSRIRDHINALGAVAIVLLLIVRSVFPFETLIHSFALAAVVVAVGHSRTMPWFSRGGDASYGMYIFAWPVQQFRQLLITEFWSSLFVAFALTTALGYATWYLFERRALSYRARLAARLHAIAWSTTYRRESTQV